MSYFGLDLSLKLVWFMKYVNYFYFKGGFSMAKSRGNGTGSVTSFVSSKGKRKYRVRITVDTYFDIESEKVKTVSKSLGVFSTKAEAEAALATYNSSPYDLTTKVKTVGDLYAIWQPEYCSKLKNDSSVRTITSTWEYCKDISNMPLNRLGAGHIKDIMDKGYVIVKTGKHKGEKKYASTNTKCRIKSLFNLMLDYALERNLIIKNVARTFDINDIRKEADYGKKIKKSFSSDDIRLLWGSIDEFPFADIILIGIYTGFRPSELCELKIENIDLDNNMIIGGMKTAAGTNRKVPIHPDIKPLVEKRYIHATEKLHSQWLLNDRFSQTGYHITYDKFRGRYNNTLIELGITGYTGHCCRVTFITKCYENKVPEYIIKRVVGHSLKGDVTDGVYNRVTFEELYNYISSVKFC